MSNTTTTTLQQLKRQLDDSLSPEQRAANDDVLACAKKLKITKIDLLNVNQEFNSIRDKLKDAKNNTTVAINEYNTAHTKYNALLNEAQKAIISDIKNTQKEATVARRLTTS